MLLGFAVLTLAPHDPPVGESFLAQRDVEDLVGVESFDPSDEALPADELLPVKLPKPIGLLLGEELAGLLLDAGLPSEPLGTEPLGLTLDEDPLVLAYLFQRQGVLSSFAFDEDDPLLDDAYLFQRHGVLSSLAVESFAPKVGELPVEEPPPIGLLVPASLLLGEGLTGLLLGEELAGLLLDEDLLVLAYLFQRHGVLSSFAFDEADPLPDDAYLFQRHGVLSSLSFDEELLDGVKECQDLSTSLQVGVLAEFACPGGAGALGGLGT